MNIQKYDHITIIVLLCDGLLLLNIYIYMFYFIYIVKILYPTTLLFLT